MHTIRPRVLVALLGTLLLLAPAVLARPASASTLTGHWTFDEGSGTVAHDFSAGGHPLTLQNGASWGQGVLGASALSLSGASQYAEAGSPLIDTTRSFTVSAWVNLSNPGGYQTFVSQDGSQVSGFFLQLRGDTHRFAFTGHPHHVILQRSGTRILAVPAHGRITQRVGGLTAGRYALKVDRVTRGALLAGGAFGGGSG